MPEAQTSLPEDRAATPPGLTKCAGATMRMIHEVGMGHTGGDLSVADILTTLYGEVLSVNPADPNRDRFIMSKGHCSGAL